MKEKNKNAYFELRDLHINDNFHLNYNWKIKSQIKWFSVSSLSTLIPRIFHSSYEQRVVCLFNAFLPFVVSIWNSQCSDMLLITSFFFYCRFTFLCVCSKGNVEKYNPKQTCSPANFSKPIIAGAVWFGLGKMWPMQWSMTLCVSSWYFDCISRLIATICIHKYPNG